MRYICTLGGFGVAIAIMSVLWAGCQHTTPSIPDTTASDNKSHTTQRSTDRDNQHTTPSFPNATPPNDLDNSTHNTTGSTQERGAESPNNSPEDDEEPVDSLSAGSNATNSREEHREHIMDPVAQGKEATGTRPHFIFEDDFHLAGDALIRSMEAENLSTVGSDITDLENASHVSSNELFRSMEIDIEELSAAQKNLDKNTL